MLRTRDDVDTHYDYGRRLPAVNVKVFGNAFDGPLPDDAPDGFTIEWVQEHISEDEMSNAWWTAALESGWEMLQSDAEEVFGAGVQVESQGRQGGWAVVTGLPELDTWDAILLAKWRKFARWARDAADAIPEEMLSLIAINVYEPLMQEREKAVEALDVPDWRVATRAAKRLVSLS